MDDIRHNNQESLELILAGAFLCVVCMYTWHVYGHM